MVLSRVEVYEEVEKRLVDDIRGMFFFSIRRTKHSVPPFDWTQEPPFDVTLSRRISGRPSSKIKERMGRKKYRNFKKIAVPKFFGIFDPPLLPYFIPTNVGAPSNLPQNYQSI